MSWPTATARSASPFTMPAAASTIARSPLTLWLVMQAFGPLIPKRMPTWHSTLLGSDLSSHIGLTMLASSLPNAGNAPPACSISGK